MRNWVVSLVSVWVLASLGSCGSDSGTCGNSTPCGGDVVGTWSVSSSCLSASVTMFDDSCPTATSAGSATVKGTVDFKPDMTYTSNFTLSESVTVNLPASCLTVNGLTLTCQQAMQVLALQQVTAGAKCAAAGSGCNCTIPVPAMGGAAAGTWSTTAAGLLTEMDVAGGGADVSDYCVKGSTLTLSPHAGSVMMGESLSGTITLSKH